MSFLSDVVAGLDKFAQFITGVFTKTSQVVQILSKIGPGTLAAILALFYDVMNFALTEAATVEQGSIAGDINSILSAQTKTLIAQIVTDWKNLESTVVADLQALGIKAVPPAPTSQPTS